MYDLLEANQRRRQQQEEYRKQLAKADSQEETFHSQDESDPERNPHDVMFQTEVDVQPKRKIGN